MEKELILVFPVKEGAIQTLMEKATFLLTLSIPQMAGYISTMTTNIARLVHFGLDPTALFMLQFTRLAMLWD